MGTRSGWLAAAGLALAGLLLLSCLPQRPVLRLTPWPAERQMELSAPAAQGLELEIRRPVGSWGSESRWLVEISGQTGDKRLIRPLSRRKMALCFPAGEGIQVRFIPLPTPNCTL